MKDVDRLAALLEGIGQEGAAEPAGAEVTGEDRQLAALATLLRDTTPAVPPMRAEFRTELRAQIVDAAREQVVEPPLLTRLRDRVQRLRYSAGLASATGLASMTLAGGGVAGAAEQAQPGDLLYGTKIAIEDARLWLTADEADRGSRAISYAMDRLHEARIAADEGDQDGVAVALEGATARTAEGAAAIVADGDDPMLLDLADALDDQEAAVEDLLPDLDGQAIVAAEALLAQVQAARDAIASVIVIPGMPGSGQGLPDAIIPGLTPPPAEDPTVAPTPGVDPTDAATPDAAPTSGAPDDGPIPLPDAVPDLPGLPDVLEPLPDVPPLEDALEDTGEAVEEALDGAGGAVEDTVDGAGGLVGGVVGGVGDAVEDVGGVVEDVGGAVGDLAEPVEDLLEDTGEVLGDTVEGVGGVLGDVLGGAQRRADVDTGS